MRIASRYAIAIHVMTLLATTDGEACGLSSEGMSSNSIGANPVIVRNTISRLRRAGLVRTRPGAPGAQCARDAESITLLDIYRAMEPSSGLFGIHSHVNTECAIGARIRASLETEFRAVQTAFESQLASTTLAAFIASMRLPAAQSAQLP